MSGIRREHRLVLAMPCPVVDLHAELGHLADGMQLVNVALAAEDDKPIIIDDLTTVVLVVKSGTQRETAGETDEEPVPASTGTAAPVPAGTGEYRPRTELGRLALEAEKAHAEGIVTTGEELRQHLNISKEAAVVFWRHLGKPA